MVAGAASHSAVDPWEPPRRKLLPPGGSVEVGFVGPVRGWDAITYEASCLDVVAYRLRALVSEGSAAFQDLEGRLADVQSREAADTRVTEGRLSDLLARFKQDEAE